MKKLLSLLAVIPFAISGFAQCTWNSIYFESYEYTTVVPYLIPGKVYHDSPQTTALANCVRTGTRGLYMNIVDGQTGILYSQPFTDICIGQNYRFRFSFNNSTSTTPAPNLTFNVIDGNNITVSTLTATGTTTWQDLTMPAFTATTPGLRFEIVTNITGTAGNDAGFDDLHFDQCQPDAVNYSIMECTGAPAFDTYSEQTGTILSASGVWTGPTALTNGHLGTFTPGVNTNGTYAYTIDGAPGCADSVANFNIQIISAPVIDPIAPLNGCQSVTLPVITGTNLSGNERYYTGQNGTGTAFSAGASITTSQTVYAYGGTTGCSDEEAVTITISQPYNAGLDNGWSYCGPVGIVDLDLLLFGNTGPAGTWSETTVPVSGALNAAAGEFNTSAVPDGAYSFMYTTPVNGACAADQASFSITISGLDNVSLGNDTSFCQGQGVLLSPGVFDSYLWDNNSTSATRFVSLPGTYHVKVGTIGTNTIVNGDFEQGSTNFTTSYSIGTGGSYGQLSAAGTYAITSSPNLVHDNFSTCQDNTPAPGTQMMVVNGNINPTNVWCQTVAINPNTDYQFRAFASSALSNSNVAQLQFSINGAPIGGIFSPTSGGCNWSQFFQTWNSGMQISANICITNQNNVDDGNDFMIDDISFAPICYAYDTIVIANYPSPVITATPNDTICAGETGQLTASSVTPGLNYTWTPGGATTAQLNVSPAVSTVYSVSAVSANGCSSKIVSRSIVVRPMPVASIFVNGNDTVCAGNSSILNGSSSLPGSTFSWSPVAGATNQLVVTATAPSSSYTLTVESPFGCSDDTTVTISVIPPLAVQITGETSFCEGETSVLTATGNQPDMAYQWSTGSTLNQITVSSANAGTISVTGNYFFCPSAQASVSITPVPNPVVTPPEDVTVCPGEPVTLEASSNIPGSTFLWQPGDFTGPVNTLTATGPAVFTVYAINGDCISTGETFLIDASATCALIVPNVFTPNNDGSNDFFMLVSYEGIASLECTILNRWGNTVRTFNTADFKWDGKDNNGNTLAEGVYFYTITAQTKANSSLAETGMVELVK